MKGFNPQHIGVISFRADDAAPASQMKVKKDDFAPSLAERSPSFLTVVHLERTPSPWRLVAALLSATQTGASGRLHGFQMLHITAPGRSVTDASDSPWG